MCTRIIRPLRKLPAVLPPSNSASTSVSAVLWSFNDSQYKDAVQLPVCGGGCPLQLHMYHQIWAYFLPVRRHAQMKNSFRKRPGGLLRWRTILIHCQTQSLSGAVIVYTIGFNLGVAVEVCLRIYGKQNVFWWLMWPLLLVPPCCPKTNSTEQNLNKIPFVNKHGLYSSPGAFFYFFNSNLCFSLASCLKSGNMKFHFFARQKQGKGRAGRWKWTHPFGSPIVLSGYFPLL